MSELRRDEQDARLPEEERRVARFRRSERGQLDVVGLRAEELHVRGGELADVQRRLGVPAPPQLVEAPEHAGRPDIEVLHRAGHVPAVPRMCLPEELRPAPRLVRVRDDGADAVAYARFVPGCVRQTVERLRTVEHYVSRKVMSCAPCHSTSSPSSCSRSPPSTIVAKWLPASCPALLAKHVCPYGNRSSVSLTPPG